MSGYRTSSYDPTHYERGGRPLRPFNRVQWSGVAMLVVGVLLLIAMIGADLGIAWLQRFRHAPAIVPILVGNLLISSRRHPNLDEAPELAPARRRWLIIISLVCVAVLGLATVIEFTGA